MRRLARMWIERVLLVAGLTGVGWYVGVSASARVFQAQQNRVLELALERAASSSAAAAPVSASAGRRRLLDGGLVGRLEIPRLGVGAMVREGVEESTLRHAVGHIPSTALPGALGNVVLSAHRDTFFRPLKDVRRGDLIALTTPAGVFHYVVQDTRVVLPNDLSPLAQTASPTLTLVTCYPFYFVGAAPKRFIATAGAVTGGVVPASLPPVAEPDRPTTPSLAKAVKRSPSHGKKAITDGAAKKRPGPWRRFFRKLLS